MKRFKKSVLSGCLVSVLMVTDFDSPTAVDENSYNNAQQSLSSLTDFSGWSLGAIDLCL